MRQINKVSPYFFIPSPLFPLQNISTYCWVFCYRCWIHKSNSFSCYIPKQNILLFLACYSLVHDKRSLLIDNFMLQNIILSVPLNFSNQLLINNKFQHFQNLRNILSNNLLFCKIVHQLQDMNMK